MSLDKLRDLTRKLPEMILKNNVIKYDMLQGDAFGTGLYKTPEVAVQHVYMSKGCEFPMHIHDEFEVGVIFRGRIIVHYKDRDEEVGEGDVIIFQPGEPHGGTMVEDTEGIYVTIPAGKGYPDAE